MALWEPRSEEQIRKDVLRLKELDRQKTREDCEFAIDYLKGRQIKDVEDQLLDRFPESQSGDPGQQIQPVAIPLTERYVAEAATLYNRSVRRWFVDAEGKETDATKAQTLKLNKALERARYDEVLHQNERLVYLLDISCVWYQLHRGQLRPVVTYPHLVYPIAPPIEEAVDFDCSDPDDYVGFVVETNVDRDDVTKEEGSVYTYLTNREAISYVGRGPGELDRELSRTPNRLSWTQRTEKGEVEAPGNPLTFWHTALPTDELLSFTDVPIARSNRELNILWSVLMDTVRFQSFATPVKKLTKPNTPAARQSHGARFPVVLNLQEDFAYANAGSPYTDTVGVLREFAQLLAAAKRDNPEDFSTAGAQAVSGFSKMVTSLPKIQARDERAKRFLYLERFVAGPRVISALLSVGDLDPEAKTMQLQVAFDKLEFPMSPDERAKDLDTRIKYGLTTPAKELAKERGITLKEAEEEIGNNMEALREQQVGPGAPIAQLNGQPGQPGGPNQQPDRGSLLQELIRGRKSGGKKPPFGGRQ